MSTRGPRHPDHHGATHLMLIGDTQFGGYAGQAHHRTKMLEDLNTMVGPVPDAWLFAGDITDHATEAEFVEADNWMNAVERHGAPWAIVPGNHDLIGTLGGGGVADIVTPAQFATRMAAHGMTGRDYVVDVPNSDIRVLCVAPMDSDPANPPPRRLTLDAATLTWCDERMWETTRRCVVLFHAPLPNTVLAQPGVPYTSLSSGPWPVQAADAYTPWQMVDKHPNLIAWVSGHLHSQAQAPNIVKRNRTTAGVFASISVGTPLTLPIASSSPAIMSTLASVYADRIEVRYRDHGARQWLNPVHTVTL